MSDGLRDAIEDAHVLVTTGAGGVGKTTTAAAIGLAAARAGRRTLVLTIDPARRLAQAMGLDRLDDTPARVHLDGVTTDGGELWAMMLDMQTTFDRLVDTHATTPANARAVKQNRIYRTLSSTLSGTQEYMAMERLHELHDTGEWDLLVVDTPPTRSALDFLDAPKRMTSFLDGRLLTLLLKPSVAAGKGVGRVVGFGATAFMRVAGRVTGMDLLEDLGDFFRNFEGMYDGFKQRAAEVLELLQDPSSRFVVITSPEPPPLREARFFLERLEQEGLHAAGLVVNRIRPEVPRDPSDAALARAIADQPDDTTGRAIAGALSLLGDVRGLATRQRHDVEAARYGLSVDPVVHVPLLAEDVHDLDGLSAIAHTLTTGSPR
ncbi:ArsA family ATPase [Nitriliruptor alkaliphilus]|uniref:ArsA family ATPase n=1 Tax=Nitriliruptor alkaliphilus TaxID=427918 RepID=UPI00069899EF|nr:ArsA-related P-loop ATPase [Nitriliruptor alkaliphilus]